VSMRAPYDPRSVTETFAMWTAAAPPAGFTWGYDSRSTTETYAEYLAWSAEGAEAGAEAGATAAQPAAGMPSVGDIVLSWYDSGVRLTTPVEETPVTPCMVWTENDITLTDEQVKAYGGPAVRPLTDRTPEDEPELSTAEKAVIEGNYMLTEEQLKAYGGPAVRPLTDRVAGEPEAPAPPPMVSVASWYDSGTRLEGKVVKTLDAKNADPADVAKESNDQRKVSDRLMDLEQCKTLGLISDGEYSQKRDMLLALI